MLHGLRSFLRRFKPDAELDERLRRNQAALKKKRLKAQISGDAPRRDVESDSPTTSP